MMDKEIAAPFIKKLQRAVGNLGILTEETENNNHNSSKWTRTAMEKYMRDQGDASVALGLLPQLPANTNNKRKQMPAQQHLGPHHIANIATQNGDVAESAGEESSPSWASSSAGNTPSYGSGGVTFEFGPKATECSEKVAPVITTTSCTPKSTPENRGNRKNSEAMTLSLSTDLLAALDSDLELPLGKSRKSRKDSESSVKSEDKACSETPTKTSKLSKLLRRTRSAGCSKDESSPSPYMKEKAGARRIKLTLDLDWLTVY